MKTLLFVLALVLSSSSYALNLDKTIAGIFYVSSYSNASLLQTFHAGESARVYNYGNTGLFCGFQLLGGDMESTGYINEIGRVFTARQKGLYFILCIKSGGFSDDNVLVIEKLTTTNRAMASGIDDSNSVLLQKLQDEIGKVLE